MAEFATLTAEEYCRKRDLQELNVHKEMIRSQTVALIRHLKEGVLEYAKISTVKVVWEIQETARNGQPLSRAFVEGIFSA